MTHTVSVSIFRSLLKYRELYQLVYHLTRTILGVCEAEAEVCLMGKRLRMKNWRVVVEFHSLSPLTRKYLRKVSIDILLPRAVWIAGKTGSNSLGCQPGYQRKTLLPNSWRSYASSDIKPKTREQTRVYYVRHLTLNLSWMLPSGNTASFSLVEFKLCKFLFAQKQKKMGILSPHLRPGSPSHWCLVLEVNAFCDLPGFNISDNNATVINWIKNEQCSI